MTKSPTSVALPDSFQNLSLTTPELNMSEKDSDVHGIHHSRTLLFELSSVVGQLSALFLQTIPLDPPVTDADGKLNNSSNENGQVEQLSLSRRENQVGNYVANGMSRVLLVLVKLSHSLSVNLERSIQKKMMLNKKKYPEELCKGRSGKYTEYSDETGITRYDGQSTLHVDECSVSHETVESFLRTIDHLTLEIRGFATVRQWSKFHLPRNLLLALMGELGELAELFQWRGDYAAKMSISMEELDKISQEIADVAIYLIRLADVCEVDLSKEAEKILNENRKD